MLKNLLPKSHSLILIVYLLLAGGCIEIVTNVPESTPKMVVFSFISPGESIQVEIRKSEPLYLTSNSTQSEELYPFVKDAKVRIEDTGSGVSVDIPYSETEGRYVLPAGEFNILMGGRYKLTASSGDLPPIVAYTQVPHSTPNVLRCRIDSTQNHFYFDFFVAGEILDFANETNYYSYNIHIQKGYYSVDEDSLHLFNKTNDKGILSDHQRDGQAMGFRSNQITEYSWLVNIVVTVMHVDINYYKYHSSLYEGEYRNFFSEPLPLHSNIEGGEGVFASYTSVRFTWEYKPRELQGYFE